MARPRIPTSIHLAQGKMQPGTPHYARFMAQGRESEPVPSAAICTEAPVYMTELQGKLWTRLLAICIPGVLGNCDQIAVELTVVLWSKLVEGTIEPGELSSLRNLLVQFGMTPASRSRVVPNIPNNGSSSSTATEDEFV